MTKPKGAPEEKAPTPAPARRRLGQAARALLGAGVLAWLWQSGALDPHQFADVRWGWAGAAFLLLTSTLLLPPLRWWLLCRGRVDLSLKEIAHLSLLGALASRLLWGAASKDVVRLAYMAKLVPEQKAAALSTVVVDRYLGILALFALGPIALGLLWAQGLEQPWLLRTGGLCGALFVLSLALPRLFTSQRVLKLLGPLGHKPFVRDLHAALGSLRGDPAALAGGFVLSLAIHGTYALACGFALLALGQPVNWAGVLAATPFVLVARKLPLTPMGLGIKEGVAAELFGLLGMGAGAEMSLLVRALLTAQVLVCLPAVLISVRPSGGEAPPGKS